MQRSRWECCVGQFGGSLQQLPCQCSNQEVANQPWPAPGCLVHYHWPRWNIKKSVEEPFGPQQMGREWLIWKQFSQWSPFLCSSFLFHVDKGSVSIVVFHVFLLRGFSLFLVKNSDWGYSESLLRLKRHLLNETCKGVPPFWEKLLTVPWLEIQTGCLAHCFSVHRSPQKNKGHPRSAALGLSQV